MHDRKLLEEYQQGLTTSERDKWEKYIMGRKKEQNSEHVLNSKLYNVQGDDGLYFT